MLCKPELPLSSPVPNYVISSSLSFPLCNMGVGAGLSCSGGSSLCMG